MLRENSIWEQFWETISLAALKPQPHLFSTISSTSGLRQFPKYFVYPLVIQLNSWKLPFIWWKITHWTWWFSTVLVVYQRVALRWIKQLAWNSTWQNIWMSHQDFFGDFPIFPGQDDPKKRGVCLKELVVTINVTIYKWNYSTIVVGWFCWIMLNRFFWETPIATKNFSGWS